MSSRSFRRRNNRRRHKPQQGGEPRPGVERSPGGPGDRRPDAGAPNGQPRERSGQPGRGAQRDGGGRRGAPEKAREQGLQRPEQPLVFPDCPICSAAVRELSSALTHRATGQPAHFDCILKELRESNELLPQEKLCYLGGGSFGILEMRPPGAPGRFVVRKRIQYEEKETRHDWKKTLLYSL
jgi:hypothetical protein